jgi:hypothetical protein
MGHLLYIVMDLDCWLQGGDISVPYALTLSGREIFFFSNRNQTFFVACT